jgi:hypothetical protein
LEFPLNLNNNSFIESQPVTPKKILIGILDWGLGHTARCIPLIHYLLQFQCQIFIAGTPEQKIILEKEFDSLNFLEIEGYNVRYSSNTKGFLLSVLSQLPRLSRVIRKEHAWLSHMMKIHHFNAVISDNRYGLYHPEIKSVFITHQLSIITGLGSRADNILRRIHFSYIKNFSACWVPDSFSSPDLSGKLGHPALLPAGTSFLGPISRLTSMISTEKLDLLIILSGPEPQRSVLEKMLLEQLQYFSGSFLLVRGLPEEEPSKTQYVVNYLDAKKLNLKLSAASLVICRSGYSSVMDLVKLKKKAILIPTPGQTEQEYLAKYLQNNHMFIRADQQRFNLAKSILKAKSFPFNIPDLDFNGYKTVLSVFIQSL